MERSLDQIRQIGLDALVRALGRADFARFIQLFSNGHGDYTKERRAWVDRMALADLCKQMGVQGPNSKKRSLTKAKKKKLAKK